MMVIVRTPTLVVVVVTVLSLCCDLVVTEPSVGAHVPAPPPRPPQDFKSEYFQVGDPRLCLEVNRDSKMPVQRFEVLPGTGWDNLKNEAKGQVIGFTYTRCLSTDDGRFLIPDEVFTIPLKESMVDTFAELIDTWHNTSSTTSSSININAGLQFSVAAISGSFSREHTQIKQKQIEDKAVTVRVQLRYNRYKTQLQPDSLLHPTFKRRLLDIASYIAMNETSMAHYMAELTVRDFGTHVLSSVTAGAGLAKTDFLKRDYVASQSEDKTKVLVSASASFGSFFHMGGSFGHSTDIKDLTSYLNSMTHSFITSQGGPLLRAANMTVNDWISGVDLDLVAMDRAGDPLSFLVTQQALPELSVDLLSELELILRKVIMQYYEMNTISGCTKLGSPNFSFSANFDDGTCEAKLTNLTFGGVFQTCEVSGQYLSHNPCDGMFQVNPKTRDFSCPPSYTSVKLITDHKTGQPEYRRDCHSCGWFGWSRCCETHHFVATAHYTTYWCAALENNVPADSGYLFGGIYSQTEENILTGNKGCPPNYYPRIFSDHYICISDDFELGAPYSAPLGGFMSCFMGNPLSLPGIRPVGDQVRLKSRDDKVPEPNSLKAFMATSAGPSDWPKHCPNGYSQHLVTIANGCEVRYCLKSGALSGPKLPNIKQPPFKDKPTLSHTGVSRFMFNPSTQEFISDESSFDDHFTNTAKAGDWKSLWVQSGQKQNSQSSGMTPGVAAGIAVAVTLCCGLLALFVFNKLQQRWRGNLLATRELDTANLIDTADTATTTTTTTIGTGTGPRSGGVDSGFLDVGGHSYGSVGGTNSTVTIEAEA